MRKFALSTAMILCGAAAIPVLAAKVPATVVKTPPSEASDSREHARRLPRREEGPHSASAAQRDEKGKHVRNPKHEEEDRDDD
jgi:hypothetical protein